jgi:hypothetical protein
MNSFRNSFGRSQARPDGPTMPSKKPSGVVADELSSLRVAREARRATNQRDDDRHRLANELAKLVVGRKSHDVELINLSGGGAMIASDLHLNLFQRVTLVLGDCDGLDCAVLWLKDGRVGLEFAPETQIGGRRAERDQLLLEVLRRNFPDINQAPRAPEPVGGDQNAPTPAHPRAQQRHPLIWTGAVHFDHATTPVRLRNISGSGALLDCDLSFAPDAEILLDLGGAGQHFARVCWSRGAQVGLKFAAPFDLKLLARAKPSVGDGNWVAPDYLRDGTSADSAWQAVSLDELEGFLKR